MPATPSPATGHGSPASIAATMAAMLARHGITGVYTAATQKFAVISVSTRLTAWTNGQMLWCTHQGQRQTWAAADIQAAAARLAALARPGSP